MIRRPHLLLVPALAAVAAACGSSSGTKTVGLSQPSSVAVFSGYTTKTPELRPYVAIASAGKDEIVLLDAVDDTAVLAPIVIRPLAVPVLDPRPAQLVAGSLHDGKADLLVALSSTSTVLQVVQTWTTAGAPDVRVRAEPSLSLDLAAIAPGAEVRFAISAPVPEAGATGVVAAAGRVRVVAALTGRRLAVVEYARDAGADGAVVVAGAPVVQTLPFEVRALAVNADDPRFVYAATGDPIPTGTGSVLGVAELDATGAPGAWTWRGLDARAPTTLVAASRVVERKPGSSADDQSAFRTDAAGKLLEVDRVYAVLDGTACGDAFRVPCGVAVLDPVLGGLPPDPAGLMPFLVPMAVPAQPLAIGVARPPAQRIPPDQALTAAPYMRIAPATGQRTTTGVAAIPSSDGNVYYADLARWAIPNDVSILRNPSAGTGVSDASPIFIGSSVQQLGIWFTPAATPSVPSPVPRPGLTSSENAAGVRVTPGFTPTERWSVVWQGPLPGLDLHRAMTSATGDGAPWLAMQTPLASGGFTHVVRLYDPSLGVHVDDIVVLRTTGLAECALIPDAEVRISALLPPDASHPGGAVSLRAGDPPACVASSDAAQPPDCSARDAYPACVARIFAGVDELPSTIRASGLVVSGQTLGYAGRAAIATTATGPEYQLAYDQNEDTLACPLLPWPWPDPFPATPPAVPACDAACRDACEHLVLVRKARRIYNVSDACRDILSDGLCNVRWPGFNSPDTNGPVLRFRVAFHQDPSLPADAATQRDLQVVITTRSGLSLSFRRPPATVASSVLPVGVAAFDRSVHKPEASYRFFVPYLDGHVLDFSPAEFFSSSVVVR